MTIIQLLNSDGYIACSKAVIKAIGLAEAAVLGKLCSVAQRFNYQEFYITLDKICEDVNLSEYQVRQTLDTLKSFGIISVTKKGIPCKNYYTIHEDKIIELLEMQNAKTSSLKTSEQEPETFEDSTSKYCTTFSKKKDKNKDIEKEDNNIVPPSGETGVSDSGFSVNDTVQSECLDEVRKTYEEMHRRWVQAKLPLSKSSVTSYFVFSCRELKAALGGWMGMCLTPDDYLDALDNYILVAELITKGESWMETVGGFDFFGKHILDFLTGTFVLDKYKKKAQGEKPKSEDSQLSVNELMEKYGIVENH